jgi:hypothetical protein
VYTRAEAKERTRDRVVLKNDKEQGKVKQKERESQQQQSKQIHKEKKKKMIPEIRGKQKRGLRN